ncbi:hypothetical protein, partial [Bacillus thuringiensis]|uniref:hypothetical protein n=1 Tax=Bacillus thuringiensis TaxID=1428 RepID=UPI001C92EA64
APTPIRTPYETPPPSIILPPKVQIQHKSNPKQSIILTQLPYQLNNPPLIQKIPQLLPHNKIQRITHLPHQSHPNRMPIV